MDDREEKKKAHYVIQPDNVKHKLTAVFNPKTRKTMIKLTEEKEDAKINPR